MTEVIEIIEISFDGLENKLSNAVCEKSLGLFIAAGTLTSQGKASKFVESLPPVKMYLGWDGVIYPKYKMIKHKAQ